MVMEARKLTDEQIESAKHNAEMTADVCTQYKFMVMGIANKFFLHDGEEKDLLQEGMIGLFKAISKYDVSKGAFSTFATLCVRNEIIDAIRRSTTIAKGSTIPSVRFETTNLGDMLPSGTDDLERLAELSEYEERLRNIKKVLSAKENEVMDMFIEGYSYAQMAQQLGTNTKSVENTIKRIRQKLKETKWHNT